MSTQVLRGGTELIAGLRELPQKIAKKYARAAMRLGGKIIQQQARANVHSISGLTVKSIRVKIRIKGNQFIATIGPADSARGKHKAFYMGWEDKGHFTGKRQKGRIKKGANAGSDYAKAAISAGRTFVQGTHFMGRALESKGGEAANVIAGNLKQSIEETKLN